MILTIMMLHFPNAIFLYPETHFRLFKVFPSLLFKKTPEIVFDAPRRIGPGHDMPIVLIVNDIGRFPVKIQSVEIALSKKPHPPRTYCFGTPQNHVVKHPFSAFQAVFVFNIPRSELQNGRYFINCIARIKKNGKETIVINDNFWGTSKLPFSCLVSGSSLPGQEFASYGDMHVHSQYSQSHVEFGTPLSIIDLFSHCVGNDFSVVTDHSYDLACAMEDYLKIDPSLSRWKSIGAEHSKSRFKKPVLLGEEISCLNSKGKAIHLCCLGISEFVPGSVDGARHGAHKAPTLPLSQAIGAVHRQGGIAYAAHPGSIMGFMQRLFLKRGNWGPADFGAPIDAVQAINSGFNKTWSRAKGLWVGELLKGRRIPLLGGNDSHGDFNRYRYLDVPFISIQENFSRFFSCVKTGIYSKRASDRDLIEAVKEGRTFVTSGPLLTLSSTDLLSDSIISNNEIHTTLEFITALLISNYEFGLPFSITIYIGQLHERKERILFSKIFQNQKLEERCKIPFASIVGRGYVRAEAEFITSEKTTHYAATSPCYYNFLHND
jgi:hypothetical protein